MLSNSIFAWLFRLSGPLGLSLLAAAAVQPSAWGAEPASPKPVQGAALLKTDIMAVLAHPDDETGMAATLALYALGREAVVANVYCTRGEGGGNMVGTHLGPALGLLREAELRDCLARLGVRHVHFLDQADFFYTESLEATFEKWGKEETLRRLVRLVRALRPEIILTMNPAPAPGQHGHHQAAAVLATEAFDAAADPERFPEQLTNEGLQSWQPRKLYFSGNLGGTVVTLQPTTSLPDGRAASEIAGEALAHHRSQGFGAFAHSPWLRRPQQFTLVKSVVPFLSEETDLLRGVSEVVGTRIPAPVPPEGYDGKVTFLSRPAFTRYLEWVRTEGIEHVTGEITPTISVVAGEEARIPFGAPWRARTARGWEISDLRFSGPEGWKIQSAGATGPSVDSVQSFLLTTPPGVIAEGQITVSGVREGRPFEAVARVFPAPRLSVARVREALPMSSDPSERAWQELVPHAISHTNLWQGQTRDAADSSGAFRLAHDGVTLFVEAVVRDDRVVSNIEPDDIKGHWRSDSVEICIDPRPGSEHTLGSYKIGIFPFDTIGQVRAARDADANQGPIERTAPKTRLVSWRTPDGYGIRAAIPFEEIGFEPGSGRRLGFNLLIYDGDKEEAAPGENINKSRLAWSPRSGVQGRPEDWGRIDLE